MNIVQISCLGLTGVMFGLFLKQSDSLYAQLVSTAACILIIFFSLSRIIYMSELLKHLESYLTIEKEYFEILLKIVGITYIADFSSAICKDAGYGAIGGQIEVFGKLTILSLSAPIVTALLEFIQQL